MVRYVSGWLGRALLLAALAGGVVQAPAASGEDAASDVLVQSVPAVAALKSRFPQRYEAIAESYRELLRQGGSQDDAITGLRTKLIPVIRALLPLADDAVLARYNALIAEQYAAFSATNPTSCVTLATGGGGPRLSSELPEALVAREMALQAEVVTTAAKRRSANEAAVVALWAGLRKRMKANGVTDADFALLESGAAEPAKHRRFCEVSIALSRAIGRLSTADAAVVLRTIVASPDQPVDVLRDDARPAQGQ